MASKSKRKTSRKTLQNKLDKVFSQLVRDRGSCERCGKRDDTLQCAHIYTRTYRITRWDLDNALCFCASCHFWNHREPLAFSDWFNKKYPGRYERLQKKTQKLKPMSTKEMEEIYARLNDLL